MAKFPAPQKIVDYINEFTAKGEGVPTRRDIARAFGLKGPERAELRALLRGMEDDGIITLSGKRTAVKGQLPPVTVLDVIDTDAEGDLLCVIGSKEIEANNIAITLPSRSAGKTKPAIGVGSRFLGRLKQQKDGTYLADPIKVLGKSANRVLGVFSKTRHGGRVEPVGRKGGGGGFDIRKEDVGDATEGDLVWVETKNTRGYGPRQAKVREVVGDVGESRNWSLIALAENGIQVDFPQAVIDEANTQNLPSGEHHLDARDLPLITIDPADAKDHDDAVYAEQDGDGWKITVAIADVSWFVRPGTLLDKEAEKRGNSVYLVDRVVPMLPEVLSNGLCSLKAGEDRPALCCEMIYDGEGRKKSHRFYRAMIRSKAGISYEEAQAAADGHPNERTKPIKSDVIDPLFAAYRTLLKGRARRAPLELELPERKIVLGKDGAVKAVETKDRFDAHKLIETMMVAANVCAAESLEQARRPLIYRVHDQPNDERVDGLRQYLEAQNYSLPKGQVLTPSSFNRILTKARERGELDLISMAILRTQSQAIYDTENLGHFGLHLTRYAHFTSPIRRYADLTVHRGLVAAFKLGPGGATAEQEKRLSQIAETISDTERRAVSAERATQDRFLAAFLENKVGGTFKGRITGVTRAGLFVNLDETGADGFVPARSLFGDVFWFDEDLGALIGQHTGGRYHMGQRVEVKLLEVTPVQGGLRLEMLTDPDEPPSGVIRHRHKGARKPGQKPSRKASTAKAGPPRKNRSSAQPAKSEASKGDSPHPPVAGLTVRRRPKKKR